MHICSYVHGTYPRLTEVLLQYTSLFLWECQTSMHGYQINAVVFIAQCLLLYVAWICIIASGNSNIGPFAQIICWYFSNVTHTSYNDMATVGLYLYHYKAVLLVTLIGA